jgi:uroporphyrinogen decarboxylase
MTGKELLFRALRNESTPRPAWLPFVGVHGGHLIGQSAEAYLQSADFIEAGLLEAKRLYRPDGLPVVFDLQMEAEVLGCDLRWAEDLPPSVATHPLANGSLDELPVFSTDKGRYPLVAEAMARICPQLASDTAIYGLITGPFTLCTHLRGSDLFLDMLMDPEQVREWMSFCGEIAQATARFYLQHGADVIAVVDPMISQISTEHYEVLVLPAHNAIFDLVRAEACFSSLFVCGNATRLLAAMGRSRCDSMQVDENVDLAELRQSAQEHGKSFGGNLQLVSALLKGSARDVEADVRRCMEAGRTQGFVLAPGCDLPYDTPPANIQIAAALVHDDYAPAITCCCTQEGEPPREGEHPREPHPNYAQEPEVILDVITLDSGACAPCQYMVAAARAAAAGSPVPVRVIEHKLKEPGTPDLMQMLGVKHVPSLCIDGELAYSSLAPDIEGLRTAIEAAWHRKRTS